MSHTQLETDYLIIGSGAVGMAFADVLLAETNANIIIVDKHHKPGGHWNDAYSFVTLHQPSKFYGVSSKELSNDQIDQVGLNKGLMELATGDQVMSYFDQVMKQHFLPSGRVQYFPMCEYSGDGEFKSLLSDEHYKVKVNRKTVDGTYFKTSVPSTHKVKFDIAKGVQFEPLNYLPKLTQLNSSEQADAYVVIGGGKTGIDACLWLLQNKVNPDHITWIMPRDAWWIDRQNIQPSMQYFDKLVTTQAAQLEAIASAESISDLFKRLEQANVLFRLDPNVTPQMFHGATVSQDEATELRRIKNVVRKGRVQKLELDKIVLDQGEISTTPNTLHIDCSARAVPVTQSYPVFENDTITVQTVRSYQPVFSAAFIAHIEASYDDQNIKNELCTVVPLPNHDTDWLLGTAMQMKNQYRWSQEKGLRAWLMSNRLDGFTAMITPNENTSPEQLALLERMKNAVPQALQNLPKLMSELQQRQASVTSK